MSRDGKMCGCEVCTVKGDAGEAGARCMKVRQDALIAINTERPEGDHTSKKGNGLLRAEVCKNF